MSCHTCLTIGGLVVHAGSCGSSTPYLHLYPLDNPDQAPPRR